MVILTAIQRATLAMPDHSGNMICSTCSPRLEDGGGEKGIVTTDCLDIGGAWAMVTPDILVISTELQTKRVRSFFSTMTSAESTPNAQSCLKASRNTQRWRIASDDHKVFTCQGAAGS